MSGQIDIGLPPFPGGIGASHLRVYDSEAPDGLRGGTPHVHTACTEAYAVIAGRGEVHTLTVAGPAVTALEPGAFVWFTPGTVHRLVNLDGALEILVLMANAGLPEAGDMVLTFPDDVLADPDSYRAAAVLPPDHATTVAGDEPVRARRDLAVEGYHELRGALAAGDPGPLERFYRRATALVGGAHDRWGAVVDRGPQAALDATRRHVDQVARGNIGGLLAASVHALPPPPDERRYGCCGTLGTYVVEAAR